MYWKVYAKNERHPRKLTWREVHSEISAAIETEYAHSDGDSYDIDGAIAEAVKVLEETKQFGMSRSAIIKSDKEPAAKDIYPWDAVVLYDFGE